MKKIISLFLICLCIVSLASCGAKKTLPEDTSCEAVLNAIEQVVDMPKYEKLYLKSKDNLDDFSMSLWCDGVFTSFAQMQLIEDYAVFTGTGTETFEIAIFKFNASADEKTKEDIFTRRKNTLASGDKGAYDPNFENMMESSVVYFDGDFGMLLITGDNEKALEIIENLKQ